MSLQKPTPVAVAVALLLSATALQAQQAPAPEQTLSTVIVNSSADASAQGLSQPYAGGQVARGGRAGILGTRDNMETPFSITSYTNEFIQDRQARSVGEVLLNDPSVRVARGFGNFQESYFIRGFILNSDDVAYNGLYSLLPRQYIATELFERVEVLRGASAFLTGANPGGGGVGGAINLLPKRAPNEPLNRVTVGTGSGGYGQVAADIARRFGPDGATGIRVNAAYRDGGTSVDDEKGTLGLASVGLDWRSRDVRLSGDVGYQENRLKRTRPNVTLAGADVTSVPAPPEGSTNFAQPWTFSNERDLFGTFRGEWDITPALTAWGAYGHRSSEEANSLANLTVTNSSTGAGNQFRFDNLREDQVNTGEAGLRWKGRTGSVGHEVVAAAGRFSGKIDTSFNFNFGNLLFTNLYDPSFFAAPPLAPLPPLANTGTTRLTSYALGDTLALFEDRLLLTLGARHQQVDLTSFGTRTDESRTSPAVGAVWRASRQLSLYANYMEGLTHGETVPFTFIDNTGTARSTANGGAALPPGTAKQGEIGLKYDGGDFGAGVTAFSITKPRFTIDTASGVGAAGGEDRHQGLEATVFGAPARGVRLLGGATWLKTEQLETGLATTQGKRVIGVPEFQASLDAEWDVPAARGLTFDARVTYTGSRFADAENTLKVPGWTRLDLGARYLMDVSGRIVTLRGRVDNVTDRNYWSSVGGFPGAGYLVVGAPRTFTLSAAVDF